MRTTSKGRIVVLLATLFTVAVAFASGDRLWAGEDPNAAAIRQADQRIADFEAAARSGNDTAVRDAALRLQKDPIAVQRINKTGSAFLKERLNITLDTVKLQTKDLVREQIAKQYGVAPKDVTFFEATNPSKTPKVGQDWDVTVRVNGKDVPVKVSQEVVHRSYYESATGSKPPSAEAATKFAKQQAVEVTNYLSTEAYGGSKNEGSRIITGPKNQELRDPNQISKAMEVKSNDPRNRALTLEGQGRAAEAQGEWLEQARQYDKQYEKQIKPRVEAMGGEVPEHIQKASQILKDVANGEISPTEGRARLAAMGETPESVINKSTGLVEGAQKLRTPTTKGPAAADVFVDNVKDKMELRDLERRARDGLPNKAPNDGGDGRPGSGGGFFENHPIEKRLGKYFRGEPGKVSELLEKNGAKVALTLTAAMTVSCVAQGKSIEECALELIKGVAIGEAVVLVLGPTGATILGAAFGAYEIYHGGVEATQQWVDARQRQAAYDNREKQTQANLDVIDKYFAELRERIYAELQPSMVGASGACKTVENQVLAASDTRSMGIGNMRALSELASAIKAASSACGKVSSLEATMRDLLSKSSHHEDTIIKGLDWARGKAETCSKKEDGAKLREMYDNCTNLAARMVTNAATARTVNNELNHVIDRIGEAKAALSTAQALGAKIAEDAASVRGIRSSALSQIAGAEEKRNTHLARCNSMLGAIDRLRMGLPDTPLLAANEHRFDELRGLVATFRTSSCEADPAGWRSRLDEAEAAIKTDLQEAKRLVNEARGGLSGCQDGASADQPLESIDASTEWALAAVAMNDDLPRKAEACLAKAKPEKETLLAAAQCPPGSTKVWNEAGKDVWCECTKGQKWNEDRTACTVDVAAQVATAKCSYPNSEAFWNEESRQVKCRCVPGTRWNPERTACVAQPRTDERPDKDLDRLLSDLAGNRREAQDAQGNTQAMVRQQQQDRGRIDNRPSVGEQWTNSGGGSSFGESLGQAISAIAEANLGKGKPTRQTTPAPGPANPRVTPTAQGQRPGPTPAAASDSSHFAILSSVFKTSDKERSFPECRFQAVIDTGANYGKRSEVEQSASFLRSHGYTEVRVQYFDSKADLDRFISEWVRRTVPLGKKCNEATDRAERAGRSAPASPPSFADINRR